MAGPIIEALRRFRENAPARIEARRSFIRDLIDPMRSIGDADEMQGVRVFRRPVRRGGVFASLGGVQTARHDMKGREQIMPAPRQMQEDPAGPDTTMSRAYDGDGTGTPMQSTAYARPRNAQPENPDRTAGTAALPVVQSETIALPPPSGAAQPQSMSPLDRARQNAAAASARAEAGLKMLATSTGDKYRDQNVMVGIMAQKRDADAELRRQEALHQASPEYRIGEQDKLIQRAFETGDWETFHRHVTSQNTLMTKTGPFVDNEIGPRMAQPQVAKRVWSVFKDHNGLGGIADLEKRATLMQAVRYAFPPVRDDKGIVDRKKSIANIEHAFNSMFNQHGDPEIAAYFRKLAIVSIGPPQ
jgi:hypothetical protein